MPAKTATREEKLKMGRAIEELRTSRNITRSQFAKVLGVDRAAVKRMEDGTNFISLKVARDIACYFDMTIEELWKKAGL